MTPEYRYSLSITSQFYYCGLPLRLDSYSRCLFNCAYCFASARGGLRGDRRLATGDASALDRKLERLLTESPRSAVDEMLARRQPIHFGGMSDPFPPQEIEAGVTLEYLRVLAQHKYPTVISTKSALFARDEYLDILKRGRFVIQTSISSLDERLLRRTDLGTSGPTALLKGLRILTGEGIRTSCRIQPLLPTREADAFDVIDACAEAGVRHVAAEHLKLPIEKSWWGTPILSRAVGTNLGQYFRVRRASRVGREWVLPPGERLETMLALRNHAHARGMTFGAADNDLLLLSDGECCCSGIDVTSGFSNFFRHNYTEAVRKGIRRNTITIGSIDNVWSPERSIGQYVNSNSRLPALGKKGAGVRDYIRLCWNGAPNGNSPMAIYGVLDSGRRDGEGFKVYTLSQEMRSLLPRCEEKERGVYP